MVWNSSQCDSQDQAFDDHDESIALHSILRTSFPIAGTSTQSSSDRCDQIAQARHDEAR